MYWKFTLRTERKVPLHRYDCWITHSTALSKPLSNENLRQFSIHLAGKTWFRYRRRSRAISPLWSATDFHVRLRLRSSLGLLTSNATRRNWIIADTTHFLFSIATLSWIENISVTSMKRTNNTMINGGSSQQSSFFYTNGRYSKSITENIRDICEKYRYRTLRKARFKIHHTS